MSMEGAQTGYFFVQRSATVVYTGPERGAAARRAYDRSFFFERRKRSLFWRNEFVGAPRCRHFLGGVARGAGWSSGPVHEV